MGQQQSVNILSYPTQQNSGETTADKMEATHQIIILQSKYVGPNKHLGIDPIQVPRFIILVLRHAHDATLITGN